MYVPHGPISAHSCSPGVGGRPGAPAVLDELPPPGPPLDPGVPEEDDDDDDDDEPLAPEELEPPPEDVPGSTPPPQPTAAVADTSANTMPQETGLLADERWAARRRVR